MHAALRQHGGRVVHVLAALGEADDGDDPVRVSGQALQRGARVGQEVLAQQEILGRIAGQCKLGKQHELGSCRDGLAPARADALRVALDVADGGVQLAEGQAHLSGGGGASG